jgi:hypothetical protein
MDQPSSRRKFLRQIGMTAAATAAFAGITDIAGVKPAYAGTRIKLPGQATLIRSATAAEMPRSTVKQIREIRERMAPDARTCCIPAPGACGAPCHPKSFFCHACLSANGGGGFACLHGDSEVCFG